MFFHEHEIVYGSNPKAGHYVEVDDIVMYYEEYGEGHPLILLHGNANSIGCFHRQIPQFAKHFRVIAVDSRASGRTSDSDKELTYRRMAWDMSGFIDKLNLQKVYVMGWSDGGNIGLFLSLFRPNKIRKLIALSANFKPDNNAIHQQVLDAVSNTSYDDLSHEAIAWRTRLSPHPERDREIFEKNRNMLLNYPRFSREELARIHTPTLVMAGDHDVIHHRHTIELFERLPNSQLAILPGSTHTVMYEKPELMNELAIEFLQTPYHHTRRFQ